MHFSTPKALRKIISTKNKKVLVDGRHTSTLQAMSVAFNYHKIHIEETATCLKVEGVDPVIRNDKYLINKQALNY